MGRAIFRFGRFWWCLAAGTPKIESGVKFCVFWWSESCGGWFLTYFWGFLRKTMSPSKPPATYYNNPHPRGRGTAKLATREEAKRTAKLGSRVLEFRDQGARNSRFLSLRFSVFDVFPWVTPNLTQV